MEIKKYIAENESGMLEELFSLIRIPSISAKPEHHDDMLACAERWAQLLLAAGADEALVMPSAGNPIVFGQKIVDPKAKTVLIYAHYDVMPAEPLELWKSNPFEPEVRDGHIWARGADDDKGQSFIQVKAFEYLVKNNLLTHNVKFIFEGEEEIGSPSLEGFCRGTQRTAESRRNPRVRHQHAGCRPSLADYRPARTCLLGDRGDRSEPRPALRTFRRCGGQPHQCALRNDKQGDGCRRTHHRSRLLQRCGRSAAGGT